MAGLKDCKSCQKKVLLYLSKGKLDEKSEWKFSNHSGEVMYASIYLKNRTKSFFFSVTLKYDFMIVNVVRLNVAVLKTSETSQENTSGGVLC